MLSSARVAHLGLVAVLLTFGSSLAVLAARAAERAKYAAADAPSISLPDTEGRPVSLDAHQGKVVVLVFSSVRCPISNDYATRLSRFRRQFPEDRVKVFHVETGIQGRMPALDELRVHRRATGQDGPTLMDYGLKAADLYGVTETPTVVVIDARGEIRYRGAFDDHRDESEVRAAYCLDTVNNLLAGRPTKTRFTQSFGCPIRASK